LIVYVQFSWDSTCTSEGHITMECARYTFFTKHFIFTQPLNEFHVKGPKGHYEA